MRTLYSASTDMVSRCLTYAIWLVPATLLSACSNGETAQSTLLEDPSSSVIRNLGPEGNSGLSLGNTRYRLNSAIGDVWGDNGDHVQVNYTLTNGRFAIDSEVVDGHSYKVLIPEQATAVFYARVFSVGDHFDYASYAFSPDSHPDLSGTGFFTDAYVGVDENGNGTVDDAEKRSVIDGIIDFTGVAPDWEILLTLTLSDGQFVTGNYNGLLDYTVR